MFCSKFGTPFLVLFQIWYSFFVCFVPNLVHSFFGVVTTLVLQVMQGIQEIAQAPAVFQLLVQAGLILTLFGGTQRYDGDRDNVSIRRDTHCLLVGDPGLGKSQLLKAVANVDPVVCLCVGTPPAAQGSL